jgi:DNA-directed RNA polymerase subunit M/transcription elongation factor TFIIS
MIIRAQRGEVRVMTEEWVSRAGFCPNCGRMLSQFGNNKPVADFHCGNCSEEYELKSKHGNVGKKIVDGAHATMIERLNSDNNPNFFFLTYDKSTLEIQQGFKSLPMLTKSARSGLAAYGGFAGVARTFTLRYSQDRCPCG